MGPSAPSGMPRMRLSSSAHWRHSRATFFWQAPTGPPGLGYWGPEAKSPRPPCALPRQVPQGHFLYALGQRTEAHHEVGDGRLGHIPLLKAHAFEAGGLGDGDGHITESPQAPPMCGCPPARTTAISFPQWSCGLPQSPRLARPRIFRAASIDTGAFVDCRGTGHGGVVGEGGCEAGHPRAEHGLHGSSVLLSGEAHW